MKLIVYEEIATSPSYKDDYQELNRAVKTGDKITHNLSFYINATTNDIAHIIEMHGSVCIGKDELNPGYYYLEY